MLANELAAVVGVLRAWPETNDMAIEELAIEDLVETTCHSLGSCIAKHPNGDAY